MSRTVTRPRPPARGERRGRGGLFPFGPRAKAGLALVALLLLAGLAFLAREPLRGLLPARLGPVDWPALDGLTAADRAGLEKARAAVDQAQAARPRDRGRLAAAYGEAGRRLVAHGFLPAATQALANAQALDPGQADWPYFLGYSAAQDGRPEEAADHYRRVLDLDREDRPARLHLAEALVAAGRPAEARPVLEPLLGDPQGEAPARYLLGEIGLATGDLAEAVAQWELALDLAPEASLLHQRLADAYRQLGAGDRAAEHLAKRGERRVGLADPRIAGLSELQQSAGAKLYQGSELMAGGQAQAAAERFQEALNLEPENLSARLNLGAALMQLGRLDEAQAALVAAERLAPSDPKVQTNLARLHQARGDTAAAAAAFATAAALEPGKAELLAERLEFERRLGCAAALEPFRAYLAVAPQDQAARQRFLLCLAATGGWAEALTVARAGRELAPQDFAAADGLVRLLAAAPDAAIRDGQEALALAGSLAGGEQAVQAQELVAMALAELGRFPEAAAAQTQALAAYAADPRLAPTWLPYLQAQLEGYRAGRPCRQPWPPHLLRDQPATGTPGASPPLGSPGSSGSPGSPQPSGSPQSPGSLGSAPLPGSSPAAVATATKPEAAP